MGNPVLGQCEELGLVRRAGMNATLTGPVCSPGDTAIP